MSDMDGTARSPSTEEQVRPGEADPAVSPQGSLMTLATSLSPGLLQRKLARRLQRKADQERLDATSEIEGKAPGDATTASPFQSDRFKRDKTLAAVRAGTQFLRKGSGGLAVRKIQQALLDLGLLLPKFGVDGSFGDETDKAVRAFQTQSGLAVDGVVGPDTLGALDQRYATFTPYAELATHTGSSATEQLAGTRALDATDRSAVDQALAAQKPSEVGPFRETLPAGKYGDRLRTALFADVDHMFDKLAKGKGELHKDESNLFDWSLIEAVGRESKKEVDKVFGGYATRAPLVRDTNLKDQWAVQEKAQAAMDPAQKLEVARELADYRLQAGRALLEIKKEHSAANRPRETAIASAVRDEVAASRTDDLCEVEKGWPGEATIATHEVRLQRFKKATKADNRIEMWKYFETIIHEYLHTETHEKFIKYASSKTGDRENALMEGMTDVLTKTVWANIQFSPALRKAVEGPFHQPDQPTKIPAVNEIPVYPSTARAEEMVGIVGFKNACAAFFLGRTDLIGDTGK